MIIYGTGELKQATPHQAKAKCPQCGEYQVAFHFFKKYFHLFWIPTFPYGSRKVAHCEKCNVAYQESIPAALASDLERARMQASFPWHSFSGTAILIVGIAAIILISDGKTKHKFPSGALQAEGKYNGDKPDGQWTYWHENGKVQSVQHYINGLEEGEWTWFNEQGIKTKTGHYHNGRYDGKWLFYTDSGTLSEEMIFSDNRKQGLSTTYYGEGKKAAEGNFDRDREQGLWRYWYENQQLMMEGEMTEGKQIGLWKTYFENGNLRGENRYDDSLFYIVSLYDAKGKQMVKNGRGIYIEYFDNQQKRSEGRVEGGQYVGEFSSWFPDGKLREQGIYKNGEYILQSSFDPEGKVMVLKGNGYCKKYYDNGIVASECLFRDGKPHGLMLSRDENGVTVGEVYYREGKYDGEAKIYMNGALYSVGNFRKNVEDSVWTWYHAGGGKEAEVTFVNGLKEGEETFWSESGEIVKREFYEKGKLVRQEAK